ncbi:hypothetical protein IU449_28515 [Nocardia higoensis]|uniref:DUF2637 domain-containing protein n=1 Tax=Nocardia higoensis TaxID=228599 RepID=A0ABS0DJ35_9NOCA|nr:hypothetical protein [Nocardia higoensis]MBF6358444.1 hypothetical protein [Nocardia higoensis]
MTTTEPTVHNTVHNTDDVHTTTPGVHTAAVYTLPTADRHPVMHSDTENLGEGVHNSNTAPAEPAEDVHNTAAERAQDVHSDAHSAETAPAPAEESDATPRRRPARTDADAAALAAMAPDKGRQIRFACGALENPRPAQVRHWLADRGVTDISPTYIARVVKDWNAEPGPHRAETARPARVHTRTTPTTPADTTEDMHMGVHSIDTAAAPVVHTPADHRPERALDEHSAGVHTGTGVHSDSGPAVHTDEAPELAAQVAKARARLKYDRDAALFEALSAEEIDAERALAEREREIDRQIRQASAEAKLRRLERERKDIEAEARAESRDGRWHRRAVAKRRRLASPDARLTMLYRRSELIGRALLVAVVIGMIWSGYNVQSNLVPDDDLSNPLYWLSYGLEAMISIPLIAIMLTITDASREGREVKRARATAAELALLALTITLNTGPHLGAGDYGTAAKFAIAPVMVGVMVWVHSWSSEHYADMILHATPADERPSTTSEENA